MLKKRLRVIFCIFLLGIPGSTTIAQDLPQTRNGLWPEIDLFIQLIPKWRLYFVNGEFSLRYRNRVMLERDFGIQDLRFTGYTSAEIYYDTRFDQFNRNRFVFGQAFPIKEYFGLDLSYSRQNDSQSQPNHVNALGLILVFTLRP